MTLKKKYSTIAICCILFGNVFFVSGQTSLPTIIPPSPETQALINLPQFNLGTANGLPEISIPIFEVKSGTLSLPISISYNPQGRKVTDVTGPVGMGWSINCGGVIARTVYGKPDESSSFPSTMPQAYSLSNRDDHSFLAASYYDGNGTVPENYDTEYDVFSYQCAGKSGKFVYGKNGVTYFFPFSNLVVDRVNGFPGTITDGNGDVYEYGSTERQTFSKNSQSASFSITTAAYLTKIKSIYGDEINLSYVPHQIEVNMKSQTRTLYDNQTVDWIGMPSSFLQVQNMATTINSGRVSEISFKHGKVVFEFTNMNDQIRYIRIYDSSNQLIRSFEFVYSILDNSNYVYALGGNPQLPNVDSYRKLDQIKILDKNGNQVQHYGFEYNPSEYFPVESRDYWGFRNSSTQTNLLPDYYTNYNGGTLNVGNGADRTPHPEYAMKGVLKKIIYPTGGTTEFIYEGNKILNGINNIVNGPGLRTKEIRFFSEGQLASSKTFQYPEYGQTAFYPTSNYLYRAEESRTLPNYRVYKPGNDDNDYYNFSYRKREFSSEVEAELQPLMDAGIFYPTVTEYVNGSTAVGKTVYGYEGGYIGFPSAVYPPSAGIYSSGGVVIQQDEFARHYYLPALILNNSPRLGSVTQFKFNPAAPDFFEEVSGTAYQYTMRNGEPLKGLKIFKYLFYPQDYYTISYEQRGSVIDGFPTYSYVNYEIPTGNYELTSVTEALDGISKVKNIIYNTHHLDSVTTSSSSTGDVIRTEKFYPFDYPLNVAMQSLLTKNRITGIIESKVTNVTKNKIIDASRTNYFDWGNGIVEPSVIEGFSTTGGLEPRVIIHGYDPSGKIKSVSRVKGPKISYLYGYKGDSPILEIANAEYGDVEAAIGGEYNVNYYRMSNPDKATVDALVGTLQGALPKAQIKSFSYQPLYGMRSSTDVKGMSTYYDYDDFQRLKTLKDLEGNIIRQNDYHYKQP
ncbi:hypothetical protein ACTJKN_02575 [Pedobacter sp. 22163]|uniref:hypothetical protein n=1 Tax=Pedobacter sp. 22163 TaxID=3453883 RepID=UPI003F86195A